MPQLHAFITKHTTLQSLCDAWEAVMDLDTLLLAVAHLHILSDQLQVQWPSGPGGHRGYLICNTHNS